MSDLDPRTQQVIAEGEAAWLKVSSGNWDESAWKIMGTALILLRQDVLIDLESNVARGKTYNTAFARRLDGTAFKTMEAVARSNLLFIMEPANRIVLDGLMAAWTPDQRARRAHPTTLAQAVRKALRPPKPAPQPKPTAQPAASASQGAEIERLRKRVAELEAASPSQTEPEVPFSDLVKLSREKLEIAAFRAWMKADQLRDELAKVRAWARESEPEQVAALRRVIAGYQQAEVRRDAANRAKQTKAAKAAKALADGEADPRIAQLQKLLNRTRAESNALARLKGFPSFTTNAAIVKVLSRDTSPEGLAGLKAYNAWKADAKTARSRPR